MKTSQDLRIACIGNMNNNMFAVVRYLRDNGFDATLICLSDEYGHFGPEADSYDLSYQKYTRRVKWGGFREFGRVGWEVVAGDLRDYDVLIGSGLAAAYIEGIGRVLDVFIPYGADLYDLPFPHLVMPARQLQQLRLARAQMAGIRRSKHVMLDVGCELYERALQRIMLRGIRLKLGVPMLYLPMYQQGGTVDPSSCTHWGGEFRRIRAESELIVFHHARHLWQSSPSMELGKGNDRLIQAFARLVARHQGKSFALITFEYGDDVMHSQALVQKLGIAGSVHWFPKSCRKDIMVGLNMADIGTGDFSLASFSGGVQYEVMAAGKPLIHNRGDVSTYKAAYSSLYPVVNALTVDEIGDGLEKLYLDRGLRESLGIGGQNWLRDEVIDRSVQALCQIVQEAAIV